jgi:phosphatidylserine decarboxylase
MGWFEHGSTIVMLAPASWSFAGGIHLGQVIRQGGPLMILPRTSV